MALRWIRVMGALALLLVSAGCQASGPSTRFTVSDERLRSSDPTTQAQATLETFFNALSSGDSDRANALLAPGRGPHDWKIRRLVVESIEPVDDDVFRGSEGATGRKPLEQRAFRAPVRMWPADGSVEPGERLDWVWFLERGKDGQWRVLDWGVP